MDARTNRKVCQQASGVPESDGLAQEQRALVGMLNLLTELIERHDEPERPACYRFERATVCLGSLTRAT